MHPFQEPSEKNTSAEPPASLGHTLCPELTMSESMRRFERDEWCDNESEPQSKDRGSRGWDCFWMSNLRRGLFQQPGPHGLGNEGDSLVRHSLLLTCFYVGSLYVHKTFSSFNKILSISCTKIRRQFLFRSFNSFFHRNIYYYFLTI